MDIYGGAGAGYRTSVQQQMDEDYDTPGHFGKNSNYYDLSDDRLVDSPLERDSTAAYYETYYGTGRRATAQGRKQRSQKYRYIHAGTCSEYTVRKNLIISRM